MYHLVMTMVQIRDVPEEMHREMKARAARAGMSLSDYLRTELAKLLSRPTMREVLERAAPRSPGVSTTEIVRAIRADRDSR